MIFLDIVITPTLAFSLILLLISKEHDSLTEKSIPETLEEGAVYSGSKKVISGGELSFVDANRFCANRQLNIFRAAADDDMNELFTVLNAQTAWCSIYKSAVTGDLSSSDELAAISLTKHNKIEMEQLDLTTVDVTRSMYIEKVDDRLIYRVAEKGDVQGTLCMTNRRVPDR